MSEFVEVARLDEVPPGTGSTFSVGDTQVAIFNVGGTVYAMGDACKHSGFSLGSGKLEGKILTCRAHGWRYDASTGCTMHVPGYGVAKYAAKVEGDKIFVALA